MTYKLELHLEQGYIHLVYEGAIQAKERTEARDKVFEACRQHGLSHSLVDMRLCDFQLSTADAMRFAREFEAAKLPDNYRLACIIHSGVDPDGLVGSLIYLNGINIKYFHTQEDALNWLMAV